MSDGWEKRDFYIAEIGGKPRAVNGFVRCWLGLSIAINGSPKGRRPPVWSLTQIGTGHRVCLLRGQAETVIPVATKIGNLVDWEFYGLDGWKNIDSDLPTKVVEILNASPWVVVSGVPYVPGDRDAAKSVAALVMS